MISALVGLHLLSILSLATCSILLPSSEVKPSQCRLPAKLTREIRSYKSTVQTIIDSVVGGKYRGEVWNELAYFIDKFGARPACSQNSENAIDYMVERSQGILDNVHTEPLKAPVWIRGQESATLLSPRHKRLSMMGMGASVGTSGLNGITAEAIVVKDFDELFKRAAEVPGKIVVFAQKFDTYPKTKIYRTKSASIAARLGAVATLVRSLTPFSLNSPHTGWQNYEKGVPKIPAACISVENANMLLRMERRGSKIIINLKMEAMMLQPRGTRNVVADVAGSNETNLYVIVSGHLDSWDVGDGAVDDGGGAFVSWYTAVLLKKLGLTPRRSVRVVLWGAEEVGRYGAKAYKKAHPDEEIVLAIESDEGTFNPTGMHMKGTYEATCIVEEILKLLAPLSATKLIRTEEVGSDTMVWKNTDVPTADLNADDGRYFLFHHTEADTMEAEDSDWLDKCLAVMASVSYVVADLSVRLPHGPFQKSNGWSYTPKNK